MLIKTTDLKIGDVIIISCFSQLQILKIYRLPKKISLHTCNVGADLVLDNRNIDFKDSSKSRKFNKNLAYRDIWLLSREE